jgi:hypothetical protein
VAPKLRVSVFGRDLPLRLRRQRRSDGAPSRRDPRVQRIQTWLTQRLQRIRVSAAVDLITEALLILVAGVDIDALRLRVNCGSPDPAVTGTVAASLAALSGVLAPVMVLDPSFDWAAEDEHAELDCDVSASFRPLLLGFQLFRYAFWSRNKRYAHEHL